MKVRASRIFAIPDTHHPWASREGLRAAIRLLAKLGFGKDDAVIQLGDLNDLFAFSNYAKSLNVLTPAEEVTRARRDGVRMWDAVAEVTKAQRFQILGNHDERLAKRVAERLPELADLPGADLGGFFRFDGVTTVDDPREELFVTTPRGPVCVTHGHRKFGEHARHNQMATINGHLHTGAVAWYRNRFGPFYELNAGFMGDANAPVFRYRAQKTMRTDTVGVGIVDELGPRFVPLG